MFALPIELPGGLVTLLGLLAPIVIQFVTKHVTNELARFAVSLLLSAVTAIIAMAFSGVSWTVTPEFIAVWFTFATISYKLFWKMFVFNHSKLLKAPPTQY